MTCGRSPNAAQQRNDRHFFLNLVRTTTRYRPDVEALRAAPPGRPPTAIGAPVVEFPGDHGGFLGKPEPFLTTLRHVLG